MEKKLIESYIIDFLSNKYDCSKDIFTKDGLNIIKNETNNIKMLLYKNLILVSTREDKYDLVYNNLKNKSTYEIFEFPYVYGQSIYYVPNVNKDDEVKEDCNFKFKLFDGNTNETNLSEGFENALSYKDGICTSPIACCAYDNDKIIGVAGADIINDNIWEVGIEVLPEYRNQGLATVLTKKLTEKILEKGILPIWCASVSNIGSQRVAALCDYIPIFMETFGDVFDEDYAYKNISNLTLQNDYELEYNVEKINDGDRHLVSEFLIDNWYSTNISVRGKLIDASILNGFYVKNQNKIIGLVTYMIEDNTCEIITLDSKLENKGIGTELIKRVEEIVKQTNCNRIKLVTTNDNLNALKFYQKRGYHISNIYYNAMDEVRKIKPDVPKLGEDNIPLNDEIEMEKIINNNILNNDNIKYIGEMVDVIIDRPLGSCHPKYKENIYSINYGYIPNTVSGDGEELDCYILGIDKPLNKFRGKCIAIIHRTNDNDDKLIVVPENKNYNNSQIEALLEFQEKYFKHIIIR